MVAALAIGGASTTQAKVGFGKPGEKVDLVIGYQPYYTESWSGVVINGQNLWKKHLPAGSSAKFEIGLQGSVIVGKLLGEKKPRRSFVEKYLCCIFAKKHGKDAHQ